MSFNFRSLVQVYAAPPQKPVLGFRELSLHASAVAEAAERFLHERFLRRQSAARGDALPRGR
jgi:hypothetical protein